MVLPSRPSPEILIRDQRRMIPERLLTGNRTKTTFEFPVLTEISRVTATVLEPVEPVAQGQAVSWMLSSAMSGACWATVR